MYGYRNQFQKTTEYYYAMRLIYYYTKVHIVISDEANRLCILLQT